MENPLEVTGKIHSFESFGAVDGPGIRYIVFLQGCSLQCKYCQNRDTWDVHGGDPYTVAQILEKIMRYQTYMQVSGGGITISGGEPLLQPDFLIALLSECRKRKIHTCIDTSGMLPLTEKIKKIIELTDLFLLDIKSINDSTCQWLVGCSNTLELAFARYLSERNKPIWIRQVLIPTITDKQEDLLALKKFLSTLKTVERVDFLPYHDLGKFKWEQLHIPYELENIPTATPEDIKRAERIVLEKQ